MLSFQIAQGQRVAEASSVHERCCVADWTHLQAAPAYTSPEGLDYFHKGREYLIGSAADVFSMGCVLFEVLTGLPAFGREEDSYFGVPEWRQKTALRQAVWVSLYAAHAMHKLYLKWGHHVSCAAYTQFMLE